MNDNWMVAPDSSKKLQNPGKPYLMKPATKYFEDINSTVDSNRPSIMRKSMIRSGQSLNLITSWENTQLFEDLQEIISEYSMEFDDEVPDYE